MICKTIENSYKNINSNEDTPINKKCAAEAAHEKYIAPTVAKQIPQTNKCMQKQSICIFAERHKNTHT